MSALVVGPGLGRDDTALFAAARALDRARALGVPVVVDADGLFLVTQSPPLIMGNTRAVLTPNVVEFERLWSRVHGDVAKPEDVGAAARALSKR
jgi:ATP-dependent NAD(P)H-hydrate dehydratase